MNSKDRAVLYGLAIGDGHISYRTRYKDGKYRYEQAELIIGHGSKQRDYIEYKADLLHSILGGKRPKIACTKTVLKDTNKVYSGYRIAKTHRYFRRMHKLLYKDSRKKTLTRGILNYCDATTLALWYMDDGTILSNTNKAGEITSLGFRICTQFETEEEANIVVQWLRASFNIEARYFISKEKYDIGGSTSATLRLVSTIQKYVHKSMLYKIMPALTFVFRKSARHPNFRVDDDIVQSLEKSKEVSE